MAFIDDDKLARLRRVDDKVEGIAAARDGRLR